MYEREREICDSRPNLGPWCKWRRELAQNVPFAGGIGQWYGQGYVMASGPLSLSEDQSGA